MEKKHSFVIGLAVCDQPIVLTQPGKVITTTDHLDLPLGINYGTEQEIREKINVLLDKFFADLNNS